MALANGEIADAEDISEEIAAIVNIPIAGVIAWFSHISGAPALPINFVECDGQTLSNTLSLLDGQVIPDLNTAMRFLRGNATSGGTGGAATHVLTNSEMPAHTHTFDANYGTGGEDSGPYNRAGNNNDTTGTPSTDSTGGGAAHNNEPQFMNCIWVMRIY